MVLAEGRQQGIVGCRILVLCALMGLWGCNRAFAPAPVLEAALAVEPTSLDPAAPANPGGDTVFAQIQEGLLQSHPGKTPSGALAQGWSVGENGLRHTFLLGDRKWSDGVPVTSSQFIASWTRLLRPESKSPALPTLLKIRGAKAFHSGATSDPNSLGLRAPSLDVLEVETVEADPGFLAQLASPYLAPEREEVLKSHPGESFNPLHLRTTGPYQVLEWKRGQSMLLVANSYYPMAPEITKVRLVFLADAEATRRFHQGELDVLYTQRESHPQVRPTVRDVFFSPGGVISFAKLRWK